MEQKHTNDNQDSWQTLSAVTGRLLIKEGEVDCQKERANEDRRREAHQRKTQRAKFKIG